MVPGDKVAMLLLIFGSLMLTFGIVGKLIIILLSVLGGFDG